jgi:DNA polymerase-3 subunit gamma/tau
MRDALSLLDQAIAYAGSEIALSQVQAMLGIADPRSISRFVTAIADLDGSAVLHLINQLSEDGADLRQINVQVMEYFRALMLERAGADTASILDLTQEEIEEVKQLALRFTLDELTGCARIFAQNDLALKNQGTPQLGLEIAALEAIELHRRPHVASTQPTSSTAQAQPTRSPASSSVPPLTPAEYPTRATQPAREQHGIPARESETRHAAPERQEAASAPAASRNGASPLTVQRVMDSWPNVIKRTKQKSAMLAAYMAYYKVVGVEGSLEHPVVVMQTEKAAHYKYVRDENRAKDVEWALEVEFGLPCQVRLVPPGQSPGLAPMSDTASYSTGTGLAPQPSAYREPKPPSSTVREEQPDKVEPHLNPPAVDLYAGSAHTPARTSIVRENTPVVSKETLEQKVHRDPVIQEVMRTFSAKIVEIRPK